MLEGRRGGREAKEGELLKKRSQQITATCVVSESVSVRGYRKLISPKSVELYGR